MTVRVGVTVNPGATVRLGVGITRIDCGLDFFVGYARARVDKPAVAGHRMLAVLRLPSD